jgi:hypothetical protein
MAKNPFSTAGTQNPYPSNNPSQAGKDAVNIGKHNDSMEKIQQLHDRVNGQTRTVDNGKRGK